MRLSRPGFTEAEALKRLCVGMTVVYSMSRFFLRWRWASVKPALLVPPQNCHEPSHLDRERFFLDFLQQICQPAGSILWNLERLHPLDTCDVARTHVEDSE